jgi:hypothetical protein
VGGFSAACRAEPGIGMQATGAVVLPSKGASATTEVSYCAEDG